MKKTILLTTIVSAMFLAGCQSVTEKALEQETDEKKELYEQLLDENKLDENGIYVDAAELLNETPVPTDLPEAEVVDKSDGSVYVTFARNQSLIIHYYLDKEMTKEVVNGCHLNPGDCVYASEPKSADKNYPYHFDYYKMYEYEDGKRLPVTGWETDDKEKIFTIPEGYKGTDISIVPFGHFEERKITLNDFSVNEGNHKSELSGTWIVNGKTTTDKLIRISAGASASISYEYDPNQYFFVKSDPGELYLDESEGEVIFRTTQTREDCYSVEIHPYISTVLKAVDGSKFRYKFSGDDKFSEPVKSVDLDHLKYGDQIIAKPENDVSVTSSEKNYISVEHRDSTDEFVFNVFNQFESFIFDPNDYKDEHGRIIFMINNQEVTEPREVCRGMEITYCDENPNDEYAISGKQNGYKIVVSDENTTKRELSQIHYYEIVEVTISLSQPLKGGQIEYWYDGSKLIGSLAKVKTGDSIQLKMIPWDGWTCDYKETTIEITDETKEISKIDDAFIITDLFRENDNHKPYLTVKMDKNLGKSLEVTVSATDCDEEKLMYSKGEFLKSYDSFELGQIGTDAGISLSFDKDTIHPGELIKAELFLDGSLKETCYISDISKTITFDIYSEGNSDDSQKSYREAEVYICTVQAIKHEEKLTENGEVKVICSDTSEELKTGDYVDSERMVKVIIDPTEGFSVVNGKNVNKDGEYEKEMKYKDYQSDIDKILKKNPIRKNVCVTLDTSDPYGTVVYKVNDEATSGTVVLHEGDKLVIEYNLTDSGMKIDRGFSLNFSDHQKEEIEVNANLNGKTIQRSDYISVKRK